MSSIKIEFEGPDGSGYTVSLDDFYTHSLASNGEELIDRAVCAIKKAAGMTND